MGVVATDAAQLSSATQVAPAQAHGKVMLEQIIFRCGRAIKWNEKNAKGILEVLARPKIKVRFSRLWYTRIAGLVARHAYVVA